VDEPLAALEAEVARETPAPYIDTIASPIILYMAGGTGRDELRAYLDAQKQREKRTDARTGKRLAKAFAPG
jgi:NAD(P)H-flavin reductase